MSGVRLTTNTTKEYPCTNCGGQGNIVREGENPRLKCLSCGFMYSGDHSLELLKRGEVPEGPPPVIEEPEEERKDVHTNSDNSNTNIDNVPSTANAGHSAFSVPRSPSHIFITKNRQEVEFTTDRNFKKTLLKWEASGKGYNVFQLMKFEYHVKVELQK